MAGGIRVGLDEVLVPFLELEDPQSEVNLRHPLESVVVIARMAVLAGARGPTSIARWALVKAELLTKRCCRCPTEFLGRLSFGACCRPCSPRRFRSAL